MTNKERMISILLETCEKRFNVDKFVEYLETKTDYFDAPASTKYHLAEKGGLLQHSLNVYDTLCNLVELYATDEYDKSTLAICGLLHDICKVNFYKLEPKNVKVNGQWTTQLQYVIDDSFPIGHGEKSVIMLQQQFPLTRDEIIAIRWHMNGFDTAVKGGDFAYSTAANTCKLLSLLECADLMSSRVLEGDFKKF